MPIRLDISDFSMHEQGSGENSVFDGLKLTHQQWVSVVERIKQVSADEASKATAHRSHARSEALGLFQIKMQIEQPGGSSTRLLARSHDLSPKGLGFIHANYIHPQSRCICHLRHMSKGITPIPGTIRWCRHVLGAIYMSGVELDNVISISDYMPDFDEDADNE